MIGNEIKKFMALAPLVLPDLIDNRKTDDPEVTEDYAILYYRFDESLPISVVMDAFSDDMELLLLHHGTRKGDSLFHHCCFFPNPEIGRCMYKINLVSDSKSNVIGMTATIFDSIEIWESALEEDLSVHLNSFDMISFINRDELISLFCKMA